MIISIRLLKQHGACSEQLGALRAHFGRGPWTVSRELLMQAAGHRLDIEWLGDAILPVAALTEFRKACETAWYEYEEEAAFYSSCAIALADALKLPDEVPQ